jgi:Curlin associated repeat
MIRQNFTSASIEFWKKHEAEKQAIQQSNLKKGIFMVVVFPLVFLILSFIFAGKAHATGLTDLKFGRYQIADSQWNVSACTQTNTCQIYSKNPGTAYKIPWTSGQIQWATGDYIGFLDNSNKDANNPWLAVQYGSNGVAKTNMGTGHIINMGSDYFFFVGNDNNTGQLFSMTQGFANTNGVTWTGTRNPTTAQVNQYAAGGSTTPLSAGQTAQPPASSQPTVTGTSTSNSTSSSSTTTNDFQGTLVNDITYNGGTISGYDSIVYGTDSQVTTTTVTTPVTTTTYSDGTSTTTNGTSTTSKTVTDTYNVWKAYEIPSWSYTIPVVSGNSVYLNQSGRNPSVTIEQVGQRNAVAGVNNPNAYLVGNNNSLVVRQSGDDNLALVKVSGNNNGVQIPQGYYHNWANGAEYPAAGSANDIALVSILGNSNWVFMPQQGYRNLATSTTNGNSNNNTIVQYGNDNKAYNIINGDGNSLGSWQQGNGNLSTISMTGNGNQANTTQWGNNNSSTITLVNAGGPSSVNVTQTNNGTGQGNLLSIQQQCATLNGCSVTINQAK